MEDRTFVSPLSLRNDDFPNPDPISKSSKRPEGPAPRGSPGHPSCNVCPGGKRSMIHDVPNVALNCRWDLNVRETDETEATFFRALPRPRSSEIPLRTNQGPRPHVGVACSRPNDTPTAESERILGPNLSSRVSPKRNQCQRRACYAIPDMSSLSISTGPRFWGTH